MYSICIDAINGYLTIQKESRWEFSVLSPQNFYIKSFKIIRGGQECIFTTKWFVINNF